MYTPVYTRQFAKDTKRLVRRGKNMDKFKILVHALLPGQPLDPIQRDHKLVGNLVGRRACYIESDWVLIYRLDGSQCLFERMGTHADLFGK